VVGVAMVMGETTLWYLVLRDVMSGVELIGDFFWFYFRSWQREVGPGGIQKRAKNAEEIPIS
jgi:hypothetical protein